MRNRIEARTSAFRFHLILVAEVNSPGLHPLSPAFVNPLSLTPTSVDFHRLPSTSVDSRAVQSRFPDPANPVTVASRRGSQWQSVGRAAARSIGRDTRRKLFCICTCGYTASSPDNDDSVHCFRKSRYQLRPRASRFLCIFV